MAGNYMHPRHRMLLDLLKGLWCPGSGGETGSAGATTIRKFLEGGLDR